MTRKKLRKILKEHTRYGVSMSNAIVRGDRNIDIDVVIDLHKKKLVLFDVWVELDNLKEEEDPKAGEKPLNKAS